MGRTLDLIGQEQPAPQSNASFMLAERIGDLA